MFGYDVFMYSIYRMLCKYSIVGYDVAKFCKYGRSATQT
jgi:hypothetical protein